jgi:hypothetical protein
MCKCRYKEIPEKIYQPSTSSVGFKIHTFNNLVVYKMFFTVNDNRGKVSKGFEVRKFDETSFGVKSKTIGTATKYAEACEMAKRSV